RKLNPLWLRKCEYVCEFNQAQKIISKKTFYYPIRICSENNSIKYLTCKKTNIDGCNEISIDNDNILNHQCNNGLSCIEKKISEGCNHRSDNRVRLKFEYQTVYSYCN